MNVRTLDTEAPTVTQEFTSFNGNDKTENPMSDSDIRLVFSESIQGGSKGDKVFLKLYNDVETAVGENAKEEARKKLGDALKEHITMYTVSSSGNATQVIDRNADNEDKNTPKNPNIPDGWVIDYRYATVTMEEGKMIITFPTDKNNAGTSALNLGSGVTYYFRVENIYDNALTPNPMGNQNLKQFKTVYAQISLSNNDTGSIPKDGLEGGNENPIRLDMCLNVTPISTQKVADTECWDMILWSDTSVEMEIYRRTVTGNTPTAWEKLNKDNKIVSITVNSSMEKGGISLSSDVLTSSGQTEFGKLVDLKEGTTYQYGIHFTRVGTQADYDSWSQLVTMEFAIIAGGTNGLSTISNNVNSNYDIYTQNGTVTSIGQAYSPSGMTDILTLRRQFTDRKVPSFISTSPAFTPGSSVVNMELSLDRDGTIFYVIAPAEDIVTTVTNGNSIEEIKKGTGSEDWSYNNKNSTIGAYIPDNGTDRQSVHAQNSKAIAYMEGNPGYSAPSYLRIVNPNYANNDIKTGRARYTGSALRIDVSGLKPETTYFAYFVLQGGGEVYSPVECYKFTTTKVQVPVVTVQSESPNASMKTSEDSFLSYALVEYNHLPTWIRTASFGTPDDAGNKVTIKDSDGNTKVEVLPTTVKTVLDAMITIVPNQSGRSYFDMYAESVDPDLKNRVMRYIRGDTQESTSYEPVNRWRDRSLNSDATERGLFDQYMEENLEYIVLATARHIYGGEDGDSYGFKAIRALYKEDTIPPEYEGKPLVMASITSVKNEKDELVHRDEWQKSENPAQYSYTGEVTITFSKELYQVVGNIRKAVWAVNSGYASGENAVSVMDIVGGNRTKFSIPTGSIVRGPTNTFTFKFTDLNGVEGITFFGTGNIGNGNGITTAKKLRLTFDPSLKSKDYEGYFLDINQPGFRVTWGN